MPTYLPPETFAAQAVRARIETFCSEFGVSRPTIRARNGEVVVTAELVNWMQREGADMQWIMTGDPMSALRVWRQQKLQAAIMQASNRDVRELEASGALSPSIVEV